MADPKIASEEAKQEAEDIMLKVVELIHPLSQELRSAVLGSLTYAYATWEEVAGWQTRR
jgi:hypothetical protein